MIDFVSIDVEGSELDVLRGWSGDARLVVLEANTAEVRHRLVSCMSERGYVLARQLHQNLFFVRNRSDAALLAQSRLRIRTVATVHPLGSQATLGSMTGRVIRIAPER